MRDVIFRGKTLPKEEGKAFNNVWVEGDLVVSQDKYYIHPQANAFKVEGDLSKLLVLHEVIPETVGQFTGLTDKNGKKIFDGDIVKHWHINETVFFRDGAFGTSYKGSAILLMTAKKRSEVIGNIHDNPELLEGKE